MPAGRRRHSCDKCLTDHKSCNRVYNSDGNLVGCRRCLQMVSVGSCSLSSSNHAFLSAKSKSSSPICDIIPRRDDSVDAAAGRTDDDKILMPSTVKAKSLSPNLQYNPKEGRLFIDATIMTTRGHLSLEDEELHETQTVVDSDDSEYHPSDEELAHYMDPDNSPTIISRRYAYAKTPCRGCAAFFIINPLCPQ
eukprot:scaffold19184_cov46-Cyclotella_meneghiniana.AAC.10